jgi:rhamnogalacturonyl hydrolase YesR
MMKSILIIVLSICLAESSGAQILPVKQEVMNALKLANGHWIRSHPDPGNNQWARAAYFSGNMDLYRVYPKNRWLEYAILWAENNGWTLSGGSGTRNADNQCIGQIYIDLYLQDDVKEDHKIARIRESIDSMAAGEKIDDWWWIDALYMAMPVFTRLGILYSDTAYFNRMYEMYSDTKVRRGLYNNETGLWYRDESFAPPYTTPNGLDSYWSRGNGWVFGAHVRVLQGLPADDPNRPEYIETFQSMAAALLARQREDGFWNVSLDDPDDFGGPETSGTSFFTYGMAWGINNDLLDSAVYYPAVAKAWNGLVTVALHEDGYLGYIQGVGSNPSSSQPVTYETTSDFGVGAFLLAGSEVLKLSEGEMPKPAVFFMDSVIVHDENHLLVYFNDSVDAISGTDPSNYSIDSVNIHQISLGDDPRSTLLEISGLHHGVHRLVISNITSLSGNPVEPGEAMQFLYTGGITVSASSFEPGSDNRPERTLDFNFDTRWSAEGSGQWIQYDLGAVQTVTSLDIAFFRGNQRKAFFNITLSRDNTVFHRVFEGESPDTTLELVKYDFPDRDARYVRITGFGNSGSMWNSITEVRINLLNTTYQGNNIPDPVDAFTLYPNPFDNGILYIQTALNTGETCPVQVYHANGRNATGGVCIVAAGGELQLKGLRLSPGIYWVTLGNTGPGKARLLLVR